MIRINSICSTWLAAGYLLPAVLLAFLAGNSFSDELHIGTNATQPSVDPADLPVDPSAVQAFETAAQLAAWARAHHDPVELAAAARLLAANCQAMPLDKNHLKSLTTEKQAAVAKALPPFTPQDLLKEARVLAKDSPENLAAIDVIEKTVATVRGHPGGAFVDHDVLLPDNGKMTYTITFAGSQPMEVAVFANGPAAIDWHVYDENGNEVKSQSTERFLSTPKWSGPFKVTLTNKTKGYIPYTVATN